MATLELKAYEIFKSKLGAEEAEIVIDYIENKVEKNVEHNIKSLATKGDINELKEATKEDIGKLREATREDISKLREATKEDVSKLREELTLTKAELKVEIATVKSDMLRAVYVVGLVQFLAIVGSVIAIINFLAK